MRDSVIAELKVIPLVPSATGVSRYIAAVIDVIKKAEGITYQVTPMATIVQGPLTRVLQLAQEMHEVPFTMGAVRVLTSITIDDRRDKYVTMESKVKSVLQ
ncbi:MAG: MTH1187 family thiamine-binding protein [Dehalococcoidia bacterium]|nr:MTH1187 family thiamine-binding protein [Dehalococcoidia bacterium]